MMVIVVFLDISAAYDNVAIEIMIRELNKNGAPSKICWLLWNLLKMKVNKYVVNGKVVEQRTSYVGLSQGLPIAPLCFNLVTCDIDNNLEQDVQLLQFADDSAVYIKGRNIKYMETQINKTVKNLNEWTANKGFQFSTTKSEVMVFSRKHQNIKVKIKMGNQELKQVECFKYLGIILDRKLNFNDQIKSATNSAMRASNLMRSLAGTKWGMDPKCLDMLYKACIRSKLEFCSFIYPLHNKKLLKMERVQWKACRIITGCMLSTHTQSLEVIAAVPPLKMRIKKMTEKFLTVLASIINHPMVDKLRTLRALNHDFMNHQLNNDLFKFNDFPFYNKHGWDSNTKIVDKQMKNRMRKKEDCSNVELQQMFMKITRTTMKDYKLMYTDGSKTKDGTSYAFCNEHGDEGNKVKLVNDDVSIFVAEAAAIRDCLLYIDTNCAPGKYCIVSDSLSVISAVEAKTNSFKRHHIIGGILDIIHKLLNLNFKIKILWAPSHVGIKGNEAVDKMAQEAIINPNIRLMETLHFSDLQASQHKLQTERWQDQWNHSDKGRICFSIIPKVNEKPWFQNVLFSRKRIVFWNRIIANHTTTNSSLNRFNIVENPHCQCGNFHSIDHILFECQLTRKQNIINKLELLGFKEPFIIRDIIGNQLENKCYEAMNIIAEGFENEI